MLIQVDTFSVRPIGDFESAGQRRGAGRPMSSARHVHRPRSGQRGRESGRHRERRRRGRHRRGPVHLQCARAAEGRAALQGHVVSQKVVPAATVR